MTPGHAFHFPRESSVQSVLAGKTLIKSMGHFCPGHAPDALIEWDVRPDGQPDSLGIVLSVRFDSEARQ